MRIFGPKRDEVTGEWRKLCNEELNNLYSSLNIIGAVHVACAGERRGVYRVLMEKSVERDQLEDPALDGTMILRLIFKE